MTLKTLRIAAALFLAGSSAAAMAQSSGTIQKLKETGEIVLGHRESAIPFSYIDQNQKPVGFSLDICHKIVEQLKSKLDLPNLRVSYQAVTASNRIPLLVNGSADIECGSTTNTKERQKAVDFLYTTYVTGTKILVRVDSGIKDLEDLKGKSIAVTAGTNNIKAVQKASQDQGLDLKLVYGKDHAVNFLQLQNGRVDGFSTDDVLLSGMRAAARQPKDFTLVGPFLSTEPYALMVRKDDPEFKKLANEALKKTFDDGDFEKIYIRWFTQPIPPRDLSLDIPMSDELKALMQNPNDEGA